MVFGTDHSKHEILPFMTFHRSDSIVCHCGKIAANTIGSNFSYSVIQTDLSSPLSQVCIAAGHGQMTRQPKYVLEVRDKIFTYGRNVKRWSASDWTT